MAERRTTPEPLSGGALDGALRAIGMRMGARRSDTEPPPSLEHVIASAVAAAFPRDYRLLSVATTWVGVHAARLHVSELARLLPAAEAACADPVRFRAYWAGVAHWLRKDNRWAKVVRMYRGPRVHLSRLGKEVAEASIERRGEDPRFAGSRLRVPRGMLRDRASDVDPPAVLIAIHPWYRERVRQGPTYRADCWAELEWDSTTSAAELAKRVGCTYPVAHRARQDWMLTEAGAAA